VRFVTKSTGIISTVAGNGKWDFSPDGTPATSAALATPNTVRLDSKNMLYIGSGTTVWSSSTQTSLSGRVSTLNPATGILNIIYGGGTKKVDHPAPGTPATSIYMSGGGSLVLDPSSGDFFVTDVMPSTYQGVVRYVQRSTGAVWTVAGGGSKSGSSADGGPATDLSIGSWPGAGLALDAARGKLYLTDTRSYVVRSVDVVFPTAAPTAAPTAGAPPVPLVGSGKPPRAPHPTPDKHAKHPTAMKRVWGTQTKRGNVDVNVDVEVAVNLRGV
jgi:hypothetical protein